MLGDLLSQKLAFLCFAIILILLLLQFGKRQENRRKASYQK